MQPDLPMVRVGSTELPEAARARSRKAIASLVLALIGALFGLGVLPLACSIAGIVQGVRARKEIRSNPALKGEHMAAVGIAIGAVALLLYVALFVALRLSGGGWGGANTFA